jgi:hypothetical protein
VELKRAFIFQQSPIEVDYHNHNLTSLKSLGKAEANLRKAGWRSQ